MDEIPLSLLRKAYDPETFRREGHRLIDLLSDYLAASAAGEVPVVAWRSPDEQARDFALPSTAGELTEIAARYLARANHLQHPRCLGHQVPPPLPVAALADLMLALTNNSAAVYEMSPAGTAMERACLEWLSGRLGLPRGSDGVFTAGGTLGNLTALLAARQCRAVGDAWNEGNEERFAVLASEHAHYSVARAARILGWGARGVVTLPVDDRFRIDVTRVRERAREARQNGLSPLALVATAGSTSTGSFDDLEALAEICREEGLWLHVDAAHGGAAALSPTYRRLLAGIDRADSIVVDAHKMMGCPSLTTAVLFRDGENSYRVFSQQASYLFEGKRPAWYDLAQRTLECTKRPIGARLWIALARHGEATLAAIVERCFSLGRALADRIEAAPDFELLQRPDANIVCFRLRGVDPIQKRARQRLRESGSFYLVETRLRERTWLRSAIMNPLTTEADLDALLVALRDAAEGVPK